MSNSLIQDEALRMLGQNISPIQVANALGVEASYISQLMGDEDFRAALEAHRVALTKENLDYDKKLDLVESEYLNRIKRRASSQTFSNRCTHSRF
jgi:hypothetical protein